MAALTAAVFLADLIQGINPLAEPMAIAMTGFGGLWLASGTGLNPLFHPRQSARRRSLSWELLGAAALLIVLNAVINLSGAMRNPLPPSATQYFVTPGKALLLAVRAGINEETIFRLFVCAACLRLLQTLRVRIRAAIMATAAVTTTLFALMVHPGNLYALLGSAILTTIIMNKGLLPAALVHFLADAIPFTMIAFRHLGS